MSTDQINPSRSFNLLKQSSRLPREVWIGWFSSLVEAYNMAIYSFIAPLIAPLLFPSEDKAVLFSYSLVFLAYSLFYPLGAIYYGYLGDKKGRQSLCIYSSLGLAAATGMMGIVSLNFGSAWMCFLLFICAQHFFSGGEYYGSIVFSLEHGEGKQSGLMSAFSCLFAVFGLVAANGFATLAIVLHGGMLINVCFLAGAVGGLLSYILKNHCLETPAFVEMKNRPHDFAWLPFIRLHWLKISKVALVFAFFIVSYSFIFIFLPLVEFTGGDFDTFKSLMAYGVFLVIAGWIADRIGLKKIMLTGIALFAILILPLSYLISNLFALQLILTACACLSIGPIHGWMLQQFDVSVRCRGIFLGSAIAIAIFGGSTVPACLMLYENFHSLTIACLYPLAISLAALTSLTFSAPFVDHRMSLSSGNFSSSINKLDIFCSINAFYN